MLALALALAPTFSRRPAPLLLAPGTPAVLDAVDGLAPLAVTKGRLEGRFGQAALVSCSSECQIFLSFPRCFMLQPPFPFKALQRLHRHTIFDLTTSSTK